MTLSTIQRYWWPLISFMGIASWAMAWGLEVFGQWPACRLCHIERRIFLIMGLVSLIMVVLKKKDTHTVLQNILCRVIVLLTATGSAIAGYHTAIQFQWITLPSFCQIPTADTFQEFMALPTATCDQWTMTFLFLPVPLYLFFLWAGISYFTNRMWKNPLKTDGKNLS